MEIPNPRRFLTAALILTSALLSAQCANVSVDFDAFDTNGDGVLERSEIASRIEEAGVFDRWDEDQNSRLEPSELDRGVFELWDLDDDGLVSYAEWDVAAPDWYPGDLDYGSFEDWDMDGDSSLTLDEAYDGFEVTGWNRTFMGPDEILTRAEFIDAYFLLWDVNRDGVIDRGEFRRAWDTLAFP